MRSGHDFIADNKDKIIRRINTNLVKKAHRSPDIIYYDVTNFYFEIGEPDEDLLDDDGNIIEKGLRKTRTVEEKVVVYWSRKFQARAERENKKFLDFLKKLEERRRCICKWQTRDRM